jgi:hypothetical protein
MPLPLPSTPPPLRSTPPPLPSTPPPLPIFAAARPPALATAVSEPAPVPSALAPTLPEPAEVAPALVVEPARFASPALEPTPPPSEAALEADESESKATPAQSEASPVEASPVEASPVEASPVEASPVEASPVEASPVEASPVEAAPVEAAPVHSEPEAAFASEGDEAPPDEAALLSAEAAAQETVSDQAALAPAEGDQSEAALAAAEPAPSEADVTAAEIASAPEHAATEPEAHFNSAGSEMPVVLRTPVPHVTERDTLGLQHLWSRRGDLLPVAHAWSRKTLRSAPRALVVTAPFVILFGIWVVHSLVARHRLAVAQPSPTTVAQVETAAPVSEPAAAQQPAPAVLTSVTPAVAPGGDASATSAPPSAVASPTELARALTHGLPALEALSAQFPADAEVAIALAGQQARAQRYEAAVTTVEHAIAVDPSGAQNGKVMSILWRAAQSPASEQSFLALRKLGARGTDIAFDLATTPGVRDSVRERAKTALTNSLAFDASPDTRVAAALLLAPDCTARKALLERAESEGGKRTLALLERLSRGSGCASSSDGACNACLTGSPVLAHALNKLSAGVKP